MCNVEVKDRAMQAGVRLWQVADALGHDDSWLSRKLRKELPEQEKKHILSVIDKLAGANRAKAEKAGV